MSTTWQGSAFTSRCAAVTEWMHREIWTVHEYLTLILSYAHLWKTPGLSQIQAGRCGSTEIPLLLLHPCCVPNQAGGTLIRCEGWNSVDFHTQRNAKCLVQIPLTIDCRGACYIIVLEKMLHKTPWGNQKPFDFIFMTRIQKNTFKYFSNSN